ncbi:MAG: pyruvate, phosphate dikinase [Candidatus Rokubacteria bacterium]|nr:pyruvate, phosphate dikinase [Candidatus Rokubacteria bacterium]
MADPVFLLAGAGAVGAGQVGPKAATLARLRQAGLPIPDGFCLAADAYRAHLAAAGLAEVAGRVGQANEGEAGRLALHVRVGLLSAPLDAPVAQCLKARYRQLSPEADPLVAVRSSALSEDTPGASFAGQLDTLLGVSGHDELLTAVRACWASLWSSRALRYMEARDADPARTAVAVLVQCLVPARVAGGALSRTPDSRLVVTAAWGLGPAVAQGDVVPDRYVFQLDPLRLERMEPGHKDRRLTCAGGKGPEWQAVAPHLVTAPCLGEADAVALARLVLAVEAVLGRQVEIEWALDDRSFQILQARPLGVQENLPAGEPRLGHPALTGQPAGIGRGAGPACVVRSEAELARVRPGDVLVTRVPGPALAAVLSRVAGVIAELGGSTSHLAALARERGIPAVLGVPNATRLIHDGALVVVDGTAGAIHWLRNEGTA